MKHIKKWQSSLMLFLLPPMAHAADVETVINKAVSYLQGGVAKAVGFLAIVITGYLCLYTQTFPKKNFLMILVGLGLIFGASYYYGWLVG